MTTIRNLSIILATTLVFGAFSQENAATIPQQEVVEAALYGKLDVVEKALKEGYAVDAVDPEGRTVLMYAAFNGQTPIVQKLIDAGANVNAQDKTGSTALMFAASGPYAETVRLLIDKGAHVNTADNNEHWTALMWAGAEGQAEVVKVLLEYKADPTLKEADGDTAESFAAKNGHEEVVKILRENSTEGFVKNDPQNPTPKTSEVITSGTGFFISKNGYLLTNSHVVNGSKKITVSYDNKELVAKLIDEDIQNDIALLKVDSQTPYLELAPVAGRLGDKVFTTGFPNPSIQGNKVKYTEGTISSTAGMNDDPRVYQISVPIQPGNSGGPLIGIDGKAIGIIVSKLNDIYSLQKNGSIPQNVNYAVKSSYIKAFLSSVEEFSVDEKTHPLSLTHLDQAVQSTVLIRATQ